MTKKTEKKHVSELLTKSVPTTSAQSEGLCVAGNTSEFQNYTENVERFLKFNNNKVLVFIVGLLYCYGLRVSEVLSLDTSCLLGNYQLIIKGSKGSETRIVTVVYGKEIYSTFLYNSTPLSGVYSRFWLYRELRKYGLYSYFGNNQHASVTHFSRHLKVLTMKEKDVPRETISKFLGHKSLKSLVYYEKPIKQRSKKS